MKNTITLFIAFLLSLVAFSQVPEKFSYQAVVRDNSGNPVPNQTVSFRMSILEDNISGTAVYTESHTVPTNQFGVVSFEVGTGVVSQGSFSSIVWGDHQYFLQVELDITGGSAFTLMGTTQLMSVPYALYARQADLHVTSMLKYTPELKENACDPNLEGNMYYDEYFKEYCFCDGANWKQVDGGGYCDCMDLDNDGFDNCGTAHPYDSDGLVADCDDANPDIHPGAGEICNGIDEDCDGIVDNNPVSGPIYYLDSDSDGWGNTSISIIACSPPAGYSINPGDCEDDNLFIHPFAAELCDNIDNDCDGMVDESPVDGLTYYIDNDNDGWGDFSNQITSCTDPGSGYVFNSGDCDDNNPDIYPGAVEICDGVDNDCNGGFDDNPVDGIQYYYDYDFDGYGSEPHSGLLCAPYSSEMVEINGDCDDQNAANYPGAVEICDGIDNNCDGQVDEGGFTDSDNDGIADCYELGFGDTDQDGTDDYLDNDDDNDGFITNSIPEEGLDDLNYDNEQNYRDNDDDGDYILTIEDNCPYQYNPNQSDFNNDGIGDACQCPPGTYANAGDYQYVNPGTIVTLQGNQPPLTTGIWTILSGDNGVIAEPTNPNSTFTGDACWDYELQWELTSLCGITISTTVISFSGTEQPFSNAGPDQTLYGELGNVFATNLSAAPVASGQTGTWVIILGSGGTVNDANNPASSFSGIIGENYRITWEVTNGCVQVEDYVDIKSFQQIAGCGNPLLDTRDNQTYNTVQIGLQCWMAENLNIGSTLQFGTEDASNNGIIEKFCYGNNVSNCTEYGGLYDWNEMMQYVTTEGTQGICPPGGWYLPTDNEWKTLEGTVDSQYGVGYPEWDNILFRGFDAGLNLKSSIGWFGGNETDPFGFNALPAGGFDAAMDNWFGIGEGTGFWTSTPENNFSSYYRGLDGGFSSVIRFNTFNISLLSVRCVK